MNSDRMFKIIISDLTSEKLKQEEELERTINSDIDIDNKIDKIKSILTKISLTELNLSKFTSMIRISDNDINNNNNN